MSLHIYPPLIEVPLKICEIVKTQIPQTTFKPDAPSFLLESDEGAKKGLPKPQILLVMP